MSRTGAEEVSLAERLGYEMAKSTLPAAIAFGLASAGLVIALISEAFGWEPCQLCLWQRYPYYFGLAMAAPAVFWGIERRWLFAGAAAIFAIGAGLALYHTLVELKILEGLASCSAESLKLDRNFEDFLKETENEVITDCGVRTPYLFGLTMTNLNLVVSMDIASLFAWAALRAGK